jgi:hypothetical protein
MTLNQFLLGIMALATALLGLALLVVLLRRARAQRRRPVWSRMLGDVDYFRASLAALFRAQGYLVHGHWVHQDPADETPREVVFALERASTRYAALCVRWVEPVTSEVVGRFERALAATQAHIGILITTSVYTQAAVDRAHGLPVELYDHTHLQRWMAQVWP